MNYSLHSLGTTGFRWPVQPHDSYSVVEEYATPGVRRRGECNTATEAAGEFTLRRNESAKYWRHGRLWTDGVRTAWDAIRYAWYGDAIRYAWYGDASRKWVSRYQEASWAAGHQQM